MNRHISHVSSNADTLQIETDPWASPHPQINLDYQDLTSFKKKKNEFPNLFSMTPP